MEEVGSMENEARRVLDLLRETGNTIGSAKRTLECAIRLLDYERLVARKEEK